MMDLWGQKAVKASMPDHPSDPQILSPHRKSLVHNLKACIDGDIFSPSWLKCIALESSYSLWLGVWFHAFCHISNLWDQTEQFFKSFHHLTFLSSLKMASHLYHTSKFAQSLKIFLMEYFPISQYSDDIFSSCNSILPMSL